MDVAILELDQLKEVQTPAATATHCPVPHIHVRDMLRNNLSLLGADFTKEVIQVTHEGNRAVGMLFTEPQNGVRFTAGWVNAHDKSTSTRFVAGEEVFVCTNGQIFAEFMVRRKHTNGILRDIEELAQQAVMGFQGAQEINARRQDAYEAVGLNGDSMRTMAVRLAERGVIAPNKIVPVVEEFENPTFDYSRDTRTIWGLNAATTHVLKSITNPILHQKRTLDLAISLDKEVEFQLGEDFRRSLSEVAQ